MTQIQIVVDDALDRAVADKLHLHLTTEAAFGDYLQPEDGATYTGIYQGERPEGIDSVIAQAHGKDPVYHKSGYRVNYAGEVDDTFCHADGIMNADWAAVLYLTKNIRLGGTAFWTHKPTGLDVIPSDEGMQAVGVDPVAMHTMLSEEIKQPNQWFMTGFCGMKFNRLVLYPTRRFHSRLPGTITEPFGTTPATGRLIWVAFYSVP